MSTRDVLRGAVLLLALTGCATARTVGPDLGQTVSAADVARWDVSIAPNGAGLPAGGGTPAKGEAVYAAKCQPCHGAKGAGQPNDRLVGGQGSLATTTPVRTIGSYWPYATTVFDYIRRAMPYPQPRSLTDDEVYAVTAYLLHLNGIIGPEDEMNAQSLPKVRMPNRDNFVLAYPRKVH